MQEARLRRGHSFRGRWPNFMHRVIIEERDEVFADVALQCVGLEQNELLFSRALLRVPPEAGISAFLHQPARVQRTLIPLLGRAGLVVCIVGLQHVAGIAARLQAHPGRRSANAASRPDSGRREGHPGRISLRLCILDPNRGQTGSNHISDASRSRGYSNTGRPR
eukprot:scaffold6123_cov350-Prasinococcus_capsulatus_cf.AAC.1